MKPLFWPENCASYLPEEDSSSQNGSLIQKRSSSLPESERASIVKNLDFKSWSIERVLGVQWNISSDKFGFKIVIKDRPAMRRGILSIVSSVYDPLGFAAPFIFQAKLILQDLCRKKLDWDEQIPEEYLERWRTWLQELPKLEQLSVDRCFKPNDLAEVATTQFHHFADGSKGPSSCASQTKLGQNDQPK